MSCKSFKFSYLVSLVKWKDMSEKKLFLLDGHALVYRAHYAFITRPLINSKGMNTSAVTGFTRTLWDIMRNEKPTHIAVSFDLTGPTFRHDMFPDYKANRDAQPEDITQALPYIKEIIRGFNIPIIELEGFEADDVIGTIAKQAEKEGFTVYMVTPDKDYGQLVSENIFMYKPSRQGNGVDIWGVKDICEKWDVARVEQVIDILGLQGDSADNIPGIPGIGPKTAAKLLKAYDSLEGILENTDKLKGKQKEKVIEFAEQGRISKVLATIDLNVPIQFDAKSFIIDPPNQEALGNIFKDLEFRTLANQILGGVEEGVTEKSNAARSGEVVQGSLFGSSAVSSKGISGVARPASKGPAAHSVADKNVHNVDHTYHLTDTLELRAALIQKLSAEEYFAFDTETTGIDPNEAELVGMSFSIKVHEAYYIPFSEDQDEVKSILEEFRAVFENEKIAKIAQNMKYDAIILKWHGIEVKGKYLDTMIAHYLLEPELRHNMNYLSETILGYEPISITKLIGKKGKNQLSMRDIEVEKVVDYAAEDADITYQLYNEIFPLLEKDGLESLYDDMEEPMIKALVQMEYNGVNLDEEYLAKYSIELNEIIVALEKEIYDAAGVDFNIASPKQVGEVLFDRLEIPYRWKKTATGVYSTAEEKLSELAPDHEIISKILKFRGLAKLKSTYVDSLPRLVNPKTGRLHSSFNQALAATGRLSSNNPNLQNIPIRTPEGARIREAFIPRSKEFILLAADYSQVELRLIAEISKDEAMQEAFIKGQDIHTATAAKVFDVPFEEVTKEQRYRAKTVNFSITYGAGATNLARQLNIKRTEASEIIKEYFKEYQGLSNYMTSIVETARKDGFVKTLKGRRRYLRDINSRNGIIRSAAERNAVNSPIQGTAADLIKLAMVNIHKIFMEREFKSKMILQVHDELVFDAHKEELDIIIPIIKEEMVNAIPGLKVPLLVEIGQGDNWLQAH